MIQAILRPKDGLPSGRVWLRSVVRTVQKALVEAGYELQVDGRFGSGTSSALRSFQHDLGLEVTGTVDRQTWDELSTSSAWDPVAGVEEWLPEFHGDVDWIHDQEGHTGRAYWPGGNSGVTLDPGVDLGHASPELIEELYPHLVTDDQMAALRTVYGIKGAHARTALRGLPEIHGIRISRDQAVEVMPYAASSYWRGVKHRFASVGLSDTPAAVQTALLSLAYNRGPFNAHLNTLSEPLAERDWASAANRIGSMQQRHRLEGIRVRRRHEAALIGAELEFLNLA